jgi:hypothetical protein
MPGVVSLVVVTPRNALTLVPIPVLLPVAVPALVISTASIAVAVTVIALAVISVPVVVLPVMPISSVLRVSVVVIAVVAIIAPKDPGVEIDAAVEVVGMTAMRPIVVMVPTTGITITIGVAGIRVMPVIGVHRAAVIHGQRIARTVVTRCRIA